MASPVASTSSVAPPGRPAALAGLLWAAERSAGVGAAGSTVCAGVLLPSAGRWRGGVSDCVARRSAVDAALERAPRGPSDGPDLTYHRHAASAISASETVADPVPCGGPVVRVARARKADDTLARCQDPGADIYRARTADTAAHPQCSASDAGTTHEAGVLPPQCERQGSPSQHIYSASVSAVVKNIIRNSIWNLFLAGVVTNRERAPLATDA